MIASIVSVAIVVPSILLVCRLASKLFAKLSQPVVVAEMCVGIGLGVLITRIPVASYFAAAVHLQPILSALSQPALLVYMFCMGFEVDLAKMRRQASTSLSIAASAIVVPFCATLFIVLHFPATTGVASISLLGAVAIGGAMAVTAFPVMSRILEELKMLRSNVGTIALAAASIDDLFSWTVLGVLIVIKDHAVTPGSVLANGAITVVCLVGIVIGRGLILRLIAADAKSYVALAAVAFAVAGLVAILTAVVRVDPVLLTFVGGLLAPRIAWTRRLVNVARFPAVAILPIFFVVSGMSCGIASVTITGLFFWMVWACVAKGGTTLAAARALGMSWHGAAIVGSLMNCRGVASLIFLSTGLRYGVISDSMYSVLLVVAVATTFMATPIIVLADRVFGGRLVEEKDGLMHLDGVREMPA